QIADVGHVYASGRAPAPKGTPPPPGRLRPLPNDEAYAKQHKGEPLSCRSSLATTMSIDCGCGIGLQYCMPGDGFGADPRAFALPTHAPIGLESPIGSAPQNASSWSKFWWSQEAIHFMDYVFEADRDFREILTGRYTFINGPLAQFYRSA